MATSSGSPDSNLRRRRRSAPTSSEEDAEVESRDNGSNNSHATLEQNNPSPNTSAGSQSSTRTRSGWMIKIWLLLHVGACGVYIAGLVLQKDLHSSVECSMTYSHRQLIPIPLSPRHPKYGLYKFVDQRDPRLHHQTMLKEWLAVVKRTGDNDYREATDEYLLQKGNNTSSKHEMDHHHCPRQASPPVSANNSTGSPTTDTVAVLYIPGHWASYMQSRSIGAHGIQLTGARDHHQAQRTMQALVADDGQRWRGRSAPNLSTFVFDVYAIDFQEEGGALHAQFLLAQTAFVAQAVQQLASACQLSQVIILGHSIGGYVSRLTPILYPETRPYIQNIITLGSPHAYPVFGWESTIHQLHRHYLVPEEGVTDYEKEEAGILVAISGGVRDELIPPEACDTRGIPHSISVLAPAIMESGPNGAKPQLGMDHRAIVWCNNLLSVVRGVIFTLVQNGENGELSPLQRLDNVKDHLGLKDGDEYVGDERHTTNYAKNLGEHEARFVEVYGFGSAIALECAMAYHLEILGGLFVVLGCLKSAGLDCLVFESTWWAMEGAIMVATICLATGTTYDIHLATLAVLTLVANSVLSLLQFVLGAILPRILCPRPADLSRQFHRIRVFSLGLFLLLLGLQCVGKLFSWQTRFCLSMLFAVYFATITSAVALASQPTNRMECVLPFASDAQQGGRRLVAFASTFFLVCPSIMTGKIMALLVSRETLTTDRDIIPFVLLPSSGIHDFLKIVLLPIVGRLAWIHLQAATPRPSSPRGVMVGPKRGDMIRASLMGLTIVYLGPSVFQMGQAYRAGDLVAALSWLQLFCL